MPSIEQQIACVRRELALREWVYPKRIASGKMTPEKAKHETETMRAVLLTLEQCAVIREVIN